MPIYIGNTEISKIYFRNSEHSVKSFKREYFIPGAGLGPTSVLADIFTVGGGGGGGGYNNY